MLVADKLQGTHFLCNEEKEKWIGDHVGKETAGARKRGGDSDVVVKQEEEDIKNGENTGLIHRELVKTLQEIMVAIGDNVSNLGKSNVGHIGEVKEDKQTEQGMLTKDDEPSWVIGKITNTVWQRMEISQQR
jgi:hypothetical protein